MIEATIARRYAKALVEVAKQTNQLDAFLNQLIDFDAAWNVSEPLREILSNRFIDLNTRLQVVDELAAKMNVGSDVANLIKLMIKKSRISLFNDVVDAYRKYTLVLLGRQEATVTSAVSLNAASIESIKKILSKTTGKDVLIKNDVDQKVLGGVAIRVGNEIYDATVKAELNKMKEEMKRGSYAPCD